MDDCFCYVIFLIQFGIHLHLLAYNFVIVQNSIKYQKVNKKQIKKQIYKCVNIPTNFFQLQPNLSSLETTTNMDDDMRKSLMNKKSAGFDKLYEECQIKIQRIKQKNDFMQKQVGTDVQQQIKSEVANQRKFIEKEIKQLKALMDDMDKKFKDPESRNKLKNLKIQSQKQIQRNKTIMKDFINRSFMRISQGSTHSQEDAGQFIQGGAVNYQEVTRPKPSQNVQKPRRQQKKTQGQDGQQPDSGLTQSLLTDTNLDMDFEIQRKILNQKNQLLNEVQQTTMRVNEIMNDMAVLVNEQGENLQIIQEDLMNTNKNLVEANKELVVANNLQRKSRRKYCLFALLLVVLVSVIIGVIFLFRS